MQSLKKSKVTQALFALVFLGAGLSGAAWYAGVEWLGLFFAVLTIGDAAAIVYWRLRVALMQQSRRLVDLRESHRQLHGRVNKQLNSVSSSIRGQLKTVDKQLGLLADTKGTGASGSVDLSELRDDVVAIQEQLRGQQALLQEIIISLDLKKG